MSNSCRHVQLQGVIAVNMSEGVDPTVVLLPQFGVVGSGSILLSQHCNHKCLKKEIISTLLRAEIFI